MCFIALKHVPVCENQPGSNKNEYQMVQFNLQTPPSTQGKEIIDEQIRWLFNNFMEHRTVGENHYPRKTTLTNETDFYCLGGGNVWGSNGSKSKKAVFFF